MKIKPSVPKRTGIALKTGLRAGEGRTSGGGYVNNHNRSIVRRGR